ncbi:MAG: hypothetical protein ACLUHE_04545 [Christensenellales bacterium]
MNNNGEVTLEELRRYLSAAVPSSSVQLLSAQANTLTLPVATGASLSRALSGFSYGDSLLEDDDPTLEFSYTVTEETAVQYRVVRQVGSGWDWQGAATFLDEGDNGDGLLVPGRKTREADARRHARRGKRLSHAASLCRHRRGSHSLFRAAVGPSVPRLSNRR